MKIISGMHRSGTSIVARLMYEVGANLGDPKTFYRPDKWNPDGYFEQPEFHAINMPIINGVFGKLSYFSLPSTDRIIRRSARFAESISTVSDKYKGKVVKEVRFCLTLPAWQKYGAHFDRILICLREPLEVAMSVHKRQRVSLKIGYKLWRLHNERLLENAGDIPLWFINYHNLLDSNRFGREIGAAFDFFGVKYSEAKLKELASLIRMPRNVASSVKDIEYPPAVSKLWRDLLERHDKQFDLKEADGAFIHT